MANATQNSWASDKILSLTKYAEDLKNRLTTKRAGKRQEGKEVAHFQWLKRELDRTLKNIENLKLKV